MVIQKEEPAWLRGNDKRMTLEFELDKMGSPISTWTNMRLSPICPELSLYQKTQMTLSLSSNYPFSPSSLKPSFSANKLSPFFISFIELKHSPLRNIPHPTLFIFFSKKTTAPASVSRSERERGKEEGENIDIQGWS